MLKVENLTKTFKKINAVENVSFEVDQGEIKPYVKIDFKDKSIPTYYIFDSQKQVNTDKYMFSDHYKVPIYLHETKEILYFSFCGPRALENYCLFSFKKQRNSLGKKPARYYSIVFCISF